MNQAGNVTTVHSSMVLSVLVNYMITLIIINISKAARSLVGSICCQDLALSTLIKNTTQCLQVKQTIGHFLEQLINHTQIKEWPFAKNGLLPGLFCFLALIQ